VRSVLMFVGCDRSSLMMGLLFGVMRSMFLSWGFLIKGDRFGSAIALVGCVP
jgi:hypothetical protein